MVSFKNWLCLSDKGPVVGSSSWLYLCCLYGYSQLDNEHSHGYNDWNRELYLIWISVGGVGW